MAGSGSSASSRPKPLVRCRTSRSCWMAQTRAGIGCTSEGDGVRVLEPGDGLRLNAEPGPVCRAGVAAGEDHLQGNGAVEAPLPGAVHDAHAAPADLLQQFIVAEGTREAVRWGSPGTGRPAIL